MWVCFWGWVVPEMYVNGKPVFLPAILTLLWRNVEIGGDWGACHKMLCLILAV